MNVTTHARLCCCIAALLIFANAEAKDQIRYVAIGDSYTIGEGAKPEEAWPNLLTRHLQQQGIEIELLANPSVTGWTTQMAIDKELPVFIESKPTFATVLIGVNDWVQQIDENTFRHRFITLVDRILEVLPDKHRLLVITIPDFGVTPTGARYSHGRNISEGIASFIRVFVEEAMKRGLSVVDIFDLSKRMLNDRSLVAGDGLHPSAREYAEWEKIILPVALQLLERK
jgi:lysophospholipase L1-like esterase